MSNEDDAYGTLNEKKQRFDDINKLTEGVYLLTTTVTTPCLKSFVFCFCSHIVQFCDNSYKLLISYNFHSIVKSKKCVRFD